MSMTSPGVVPHDDLRLQASGVDVERLREGRVVVAAQACASARVRRPMPRRWARRDGLRDSRTSYRRARRSRIARRARSTCCTPSCGLPSTVRGWSSRTYSTAWPTPAVTPWRRRMARMTSFAETCSRSEPSTRMRIGRGLTCASVWVASTCATSDVPTPQAKRAECAERRRVAVAADERASRQAPVPARRRPRARCLAAGRRCRTGGCRARCNSRAGSGRTRCPPALVVSVRPGSVDRIWSCVANVCDGCATLRPVARSWRNASALLTSCTRWRSTWSRPVVASMSAIRWSFHRRSNRVCGMARATIVGTRPGDLIARARVRLQECPQPRQPRRPGIERSCEC